MSAALTIAAIVGGVVVLGLAYLGFQFGRALLEWFRG